MTRTFPIYKHRCGWNALLPPREPNSSLKGTHSADVVIVGAGFTGLACAKRWQEQAPDARIVVVDSSEVGEGNPGRNSGFLLEIALADDADAESAERMSVCNQLTRETMQSLADDIASSGADIDLQRAGTYRAAAGEKGIRALDRYELFLRASGLSYRRLDRRDLAKELGTDFYAAGLFSPDCYLAQPAALIRAIADRLPESVALHENTPLLGFRRSRGGWQLTLPEGELQCDQLVLANNAHARYLGVGGSRLASVFTYAGITPVLDPGTLDSLGDNANWGVLPMHRLGSTLRRTADGRLLVRSLHDWEWEGDGNTVRDGLMDRLRRRFPQLDNLTFDHVWGGAVGFTYNAAPLWGEYEPGLFVSCGCNGGGTVKGTLLGTLLADLANSGGDASAVPDVGALFGRASWMPPEPLRGVGFHIKAAIESRQGRREL